MSTSAAAIKSAILSHLAADCDFELTNEFSFLECFIEALAKGLYEELQKLQDTAGNPPSPSHT